MSLDPGTLQHRITFEDVETVKDSNGDTVENWSDFVEVWAGYEPVSVRDFIASRAEQSEVTVRFTVRFRDDIRERMRIRFRGRRYKIEGLLPDKDTGLEYITIPCSSLAE